MNLRKKATLTTLCLVIIISVIMLVVVRNELLEGFSYVELNDVKHQINRVDNELSHKISDLDRLTCNYAIADDTYEFLLYNYTDYIHSKWVDQVFEYNDVDIIVYFDYDGNVIFSRSYNLAAETETVLLTEFNRFFIENDLVCRFSSVRDEKRGFVSVSESMFLVASRPIVKSDGGGPVKGVVLMCKELNLDRVGDIAEKVSLNCTTVALSDSSLSPDFEEAQLVMKVHSDSYIKANNDTSISGYFFLVDVFGSPCGILRVDVSREVYQQGVGTTNTYTGITLAGLFLFGVASITFLDRTFLSKVTSLTKEVTIISNKKDLSSRIPSKKKKSSDEISLLTESINDMLEKIQVITEELKVAQRFSAIGELSVMIAHDLRNPLQGIKIATNYLERNKKFDDEKTKKILKIIDDDVDYCEKIVQDLLGYSKEIKLVFSKVSIGDLVSSSLTHIQVPDNVCIVNQINSEVCVKVDKDKIVRVFDNLIKNAIDAMADGGNLTIKTAKTSKLCIFFADTGEGISEENMEKLFTPLFTTKAKGMGFGLSICKRIIEAHDGTISVETVLNKGTTFILELPL